eukprot:Sdes_comp22140_c0_seq1m20660
MDSGIDEYELKLPPSDGISSCRFGRADDSMLLVTSWDKTLRLYNPITNSQTSSIECDAPLLDGCFDAYQRSAFAGGLSQKVDEYDLETGNMTALGKHSAPVKCFDYSKDVDLLVTGSWDKTLKLWDNRSKNPCIATLLQPERVYTVALSGHRVVVGTANRHVWIWDLRNIGFVHQKRESSLKYQTRCISCNPNGQGFVLTSIEGRVAIEYFDPSPEIQKKKYAFKCHRSTQNGVDVIYPVNTVAFHPIHETFATGGCDGIVSIWDGANKKRICQFHKYPTSI